MTRYFSFSMILGLILSGTASGESFDPQVGLPGSLGIPGDSTRFTGWATGYSDLVRGPRNIARPLEPTATFGSGPSALGPPDGRVVSLGDGGSITLNFDSPIVNGPGADFAVFENGLGLGGGLAFLELAFVEVSSNGVDFFRFDAVSLTQTTHQVGGFGALDARNLHNLAGKHLGGFGTPFDLAELADVSPKLNVNAVHHVRLIDVVGSIDPAFGSRDSRGNLINDPYATPFSSGGFDLDAIGVIHTIPEPMSLALAAMGLAGLGLIVLRRRSASSTG